MQNPIQDLLDKAIYELAVDLGETGLDKLEKFICTAFSRGVNMGGQNVIDGLLKIAWDKERTATQTLLDLVAELKRIDKLNKLKK